MAPTVTGPGHPVSATAAINATLARLVFRTMCGVLLARTPTTQPAVIRPANMKKRWRGAGHERLRVTADRRATR
jgi:hypothetical protein